VGTLRGSRQGRLGRPKVPATRRALRGSLHRGAPPSRQGRTLRNLWKKETRKRGSGCANNHLQIPLRTAGGATARPGAVPTGLALPAPGIPADQSNGRCVPRNLASHWGALPALGFGFTLFPARLTKAGRPSGQPRVCLVMPLPGSGRRLLPVAPCRPDFILKVQSQQGAKLMRSRHVVTPRQTSSSPHPAKRIEPRR
jgi:hypothetical protein